MEYELLREYGVWGVESVEHQWDRATSQNTRFQPPLPPSISLDCSHGSVERGGLALGLGGGLFL